MVDLADIFSTIGTILSFIMSFSPLPPIIKVFKKEEKIDIIPEGFLLFLILTRIVWGSVWIITGRKIALLNSVLGVFVCDVFVILYFFLYFNRTYLKTFFASIFLIFIEYGICYIGVFWGDYLTLSYIAMVFNVIMFISPGQKILRVIKEKNYKLIPIYSTVINVLVSSTWLGFGICINLISQIIPNALGVFFSILNTSLWIYFYINRDKEKEKSEKEDEVELVEKQEIKQILSFLLSFTPLPPFIKVFKKEEKIDIIPEGLFLFLILTRIVWGSVWIITNRKIAAFNSISGIIVCDVFVILYFFLYFNRTYLKTIIASIFLISIEVILMAIEVSWGNYAVLSYIAMIFNALMFVSSFQKILRVIKEKNYKLIPIYTTFVNILCSLAWLGYGVCIAMVSQIVPNVIGLILSLANAYTWGYYYVNRNKLKKYKKVLENTKEKEDETELVEK